MNTFIMLRKTGKTLRAFLSAFVIVSMVLSQSPLPFVVYAQQPIDVCLDVPGNQESTDDCTSPPSEKINICHKTETSWQFMDTPAGPSLDGHLVHGDFLFDTAWGEGTDQKCIDNAPAPDPVTITINATKIICDNESDLPDWSDGQKMFDGITATTASEFLALKGDSCRLASDWGFAWAYPGVGNPGSETTGIGGEGWNDFDTKTNAQGVATVSITLEPGTKELWAREQFQEGYIPFADSTGTNAVSAEFYCHHNVVNFDNYDYITKTRTDETAFEDGGVFHCISFNVPIKEAPQCIDELDGSWADKVYAVNQGLRKDGSAVLPARSDSTLATNASDWISGGSNGFFSLGFGGSITLSFDSFVPDVPGDDIFIHEATNGSYPLEVVNVEVSQDGTTWESVGAADNTSGSKITPIDFSSTSFAWIKFVKLTDVSDASLFSNDADGFDLDAVKVSQQVCDEPKEETLSCNPEVNLLANGSFENPAVSTGAYGIFDQSIPGLDWLVDWVSALTEGVPGLEIQNNVAGAPDIGSGNQFAELDGNHPVKISQNIPTIPGKEYKLSFKYSPRPGAQSGTNMIEARADGNLLGAILSGVGGALTNWTSETRTFIADANTKIEFIDTDTDNSYGGYIDDVSLTCLGDPAPQCNEQASSVIVSDTTTMVDDGSAVVLDPIHEAWTASIPGATWIWSTNPIVGPTDDIDNTEVFTKTFTILGTPIGGTLDIAADNNYSIKLNGISVPVSFDQNNFQLGTQDTYNVLPMLVSGTNTLEITVTNWETGQDPNPANNPAGLLYKLTLSNNECVTPELTGSIEITKYICPADFVPNRTNNGVGSVAPEGCTLAPNVEFGYVYGTQTDANAPYPELDSVITPGGSTGENGKLTIGPVLSTGRYLIKETNATNLLGLYCQGDGDTDPNNNDNQELTFVPVGGVAKCVAYNKVSVVDETPAQCADESDNDQDGLNNASDPGCHTDGNVNNPESYDPKDNDESNESAQCSDGISNDSDGLVDSNDPGCMSGEGGSWNPNDNDETDPSQNNTPSGGGSVGGSAPLSKNIETGSVGSVLGASTSCGIYLDDFLKIGWKNRVEQVKKLQTFLNDYLNLSPRLPVNGNFGMQTFKAVAKFQEQESDLVLKPWVGVTLKDVKKGTGFVYKTTITRINNIMCPELNIPTPLAVID